MLFRIYIDDNQIFTGNYNSFNDLFYNPNFVFKQTSHIKFPKTKTLLLHFLLRLFVAKF